MDILYSAVELLFISLSRDPGPAAAAKTRPFFFFFFFLLVSALGYLVSHSMNLRLLYPLSSTTKEGLLFRKKKKNCGKDIWKRYIYIYVLY